MRVQQVFTGVVGVVGACLFGGMPAKASPRLHTWQFDTGQNRFMFTTEGGVQPQVSLGQHPNRLIIDLPGVVVDEAVADQFIGGAVWAVKVMQVDARTTRMVLELDPNYSIDPGQVRVWGLTESQWVVQLPSFAPGQGTDDDLAWTSATADTPQASPPASHPSTQTWPSHSLPSQPLTLRPRERTDPVPPAYGDLQSKANSGAGMDTGMDSVVLPPATLHRSATPSTLSPFPFPSARPATPQPPPNPADVNLRLSPRTNATPLPPLLSRNQISYAPVTTVATVIQGIQATPHGFFMPLAGASPQVQIYRTRDANQMRQIVIDVLNAAIPSQLTADALPVPRYGVSRWTLTQFPTLPPAVRITLNLDNVSPDWQVSPVAGGLMITPVGTAAQQVATAPTTVVLPVLHTAPGGQTFSPGAMAPVAQAQPAVNPLPQHGQVLVMIDPGHGGADPGAVGIGGLQEKVVVSAVSQHVVNALSRQGIAVQVTRQGDETLDLQPRVDRAAAANATIFVSIHANAVNMQRPEVNGLETYYFSETSLPLANAIHRRVMGSVSMNDRGVKQARFFVLRRTTMPAALIEIGFVTGALDAPKLRDPQWQAQMGQAIAQGIVDYLQSGGR
ncbi:N-acetylmuramoyl-L-alanine amidase [Leptolyngbya sp. BL0902]|uniref:N-acetylmuramoyl-L-alanine amidase n=1 Tax=Leptolyngbya sp. BL0902 TaxID=1115757 RepID=UPI0018E6EE37|nr:N-acetylmuramoyl-L-alanine amidase [Leptolyngbya sp. BL0902]